MKTLTENLDELIGSTPLLILEIGDDTCAPCHALRKRIDEWIALQPAADARYVPLKENLSLCAQMGILSVPAVLAFIEGNIIARECGYFSLDRILDRLERTIQIRAAKQQEQNQEMNKKTIDYA